MKKLAHRSASTWAIGYVVLGLLALVAFATPLWYAWNVTIRDGRVEILRDDEQRLTAVFDRDGINGLKAFMDERMGLQIAGERILLLTDAAGQRLTGNLPAWPAGVPDRSGTDNAPIQIDGRSTESVLVHTQLPGGYKLLVGRDLARYVPLERRFFYGLITAVSFLALLGTVGVLLIRRELLSKAEGIQHAVSVIMQGNLHHRLPVRRAGNELDVLSQTINGMLDHIERLVASISGVSNSIAHDLRTPLAELRSRLEGLSVTRPPAAETFAEIDGAVSDVDRVIGIFNALLRLAEIDAGTRRGGFVQVDVAAVAREIADFYEPAAESKHVAFGLRTQEGLLIAGDPVLLAQALSNLLDNALKYVEPNGKIDLRVARDAAGAVEIEVSDDGPGISPAERPNVVERFYRGDASRGTPGVGLGLSIVEAVARLHGGVLQLLENAPGLRARMLLPAGRLPPV